MYMLMFGTMNLTLGEILNMQSLAVAQCFRNGQQLLIFS